MLEKILPILSHHIAQNDTIIVGVSGGPDSTALLLLLMEFSRRLPCEIIVAHVNHGIRGAASNNDEKFVKKLAKKHGLKFEVKRVKLAGKSALEERGRIVRREFFEKLREKYGAHFILTAHTEDDQLETIIFNFLRGSGPKGLAGMNVLEGAYLKPLLCIPKKEILAYLKSKKQMYCRDSTNHDTHFRRNYIRKKIIPLLLKINPSLRKTLLRSSIIFKELSQLTRAQAQDFLKGTRRALAGKRHAIFSLNEYNDLPAALQRAVIQEAYRQGSKKSYALPLVKVMEIARMLDRNIGNKKIICGGGGQFVLKKGVVEYSYKS